MFRLVLMLAAASLASSASPGAGQSLPALAKAQRLDQREHVSIVDEGGNGPAVLLIPGLSTPRGVWDPFLPNLKAGHHVYTLQVNGFGGDSPRANLTPGILVGAVADLNTYIVKKKLGAPAVVGHSMGGLIGMMLVKAHPDHVGRLMIVDSLPYIGDAFRPGVTVAQVEPQAKAMREQIAAGYGNQRDAAATEGLVNSMAVTPAARDRVRALITRADPRVSAQAMYEDMTTDLRPDVPSFRLPITLIYPRPGDALYHSVYGRAPGITYIPVDNAGHFVMLDQPTAFKEALNEFLR